MFNTLKWFAVFGGIIIAFTSILLLATCSKAEGAEIPRIDLDAIAMIESSQDPQAYNSRTKATGLYQITPICLLEWNTYHVGSIYTMADMKDAQRCARVANWYLTERIPAMLRYYKQPITVKNIIVAYNAGISSVIKWKLYEETANYLVKYKELTQ